MALELMRMKQMWSDERWQRVRMDEMNGRHDFLNMTRISFIILPANMMSCSRVHMQLRIKISLSIVEKTTECFVQYKE